MSSCCRSPSDWMNRSFSSCTAAASRPAGPSGPPPPPLLAPADRPLLMLHRGRGWGWGVRHGSRLAAFHMPDCLLQQQQAVARTPQAGARTQPSGFAAWRESLSVAARSPAELAPHGHDPATPVRHLCLAQVEALRVALRRVDRLVNLGHHVPQAGAVLLQLRRPQAERDPGSGAGSPGQGCRLRSGRCRGVRTKARGK